MNGRPRHPVLLHGFTGSSDAWGERVVDGLAGAGLVPVLVDLPGHGREAGRTDPEDVSLEATLRRIGSAGDWPTDVVGYSMGARIALHFAAAYPDRVRRLVLESGSAGLASEAERTARRQADDELAARLIADGIDAFVKRWETQPLFESRRSLGPEVTAHQRALRLRNDAGSLAAALGDSGRAHFPACGSACPRSERRRCWSWGRWTGSSSTQPNAWRLHCRTHTWSSFRTPATPSTWSSLRLGWKR